MSERPCPACGLPIHPSDPLSHGYSGAAHRQETCIARLRARVEELEKAVIDAVVRVDEIQAERDRLREALERARDDLYNGFEPDNQSVAWHRADAALRGEEASDA